MSSHDSMAIEKFSNSVGYEFNNIIDSRSSGILIPVSVSCSAMYEKSDTYCVMEMPSFFSIRSFGIFYVVKLAIRYAQIYEG